MSIWLRIANRMILDNTRDYVDPEDRVRVPIAAGEDEIEAWLWRSESEPKLFVLKFPGTGGRAERGGPHPAEVISPERHEVWTINPPGYGTGGGSACVTKMASTCEAAWQTIREQAGNVPIILTGNSLGCSYALYVAARYPVAGVFLRNPVPLHELITGRYSWWNFGLGSRKIRDQVPDEMDAIKNAKQANAPAFFVTSEKDRMIPPVYQQMIFDAYAGPHAMYVIRDADHHTPIDEEEVDDYVDAIRSWAGEHQIPGGV
ncbi:MAG: alpha/beta fold hydrolase [Pirellulaceae bacterium]